MNTADLQVIPVASDRVILKRGVLELMLTSEGVTEVAEALVSLLANDLAREQILATFSGEERSLADQILTALVARGMASESGELAPAAAADLQGAFYRNFGSFAAEAPARLADAEVVVFGVNAISRALVDRLLESRVGRVVLVDHPTLTNHTLPPGWARPTADSRLSIVDAAPRDTEYAEASLICATSDLGESPALLELNRLALRLGRRFLPVWLDELTGAVGPLTYPGETACLRCFRLRADANDARYEARHAVRQHISADQTRAAGVGFLPPMPAVLGAIAAMELLKCIGEFAPTDTVARLIEINLVSFRSNVRRVLKVPRCPDCSDQRLRAPAALTIGPPIHRNA